MRKVKERRTGTTRPTDGAGTAHGRTTAESQESSATARRRTVVRTAERDGTQTTSKNGTTASTNGKTGGEASTPARPTLEPKGRKAAPKSSSPLARRKPAAKAKRASGRKAAIAARSAARKPLGGRRRGAKKLLPAKAPARFVKVRELDPLVMCGPGTSVARLFRVDERVDGLAAIHLVFYDRHGWYCEHGKACPAVHDVRKLG